MLAELPQQILDRGGGLVPLPLDLVSDVAEESAVVDVHHLPCEGGAPAGGRRPPAPSLSNRPQTVSVQATEVLAS